MEQIKKRDLAWAFFRKWIPIKERPILCIIKTKGTYIVACPITKGPPKNEWEEKYTIKIDFKIHVNLKKENSRGGYGYLKLFEQYPVRKKDITEKIGTVKNNIWKIIENKLEKYNKNKLLQFQNEYYKRK